MISNGGMATTLAEILVELGGISANRVRLIPPPGHATLADLQSVNDGGNQGLCELVDGTLVEKAMGYEASVVAASILFILKKFITPYGLGIISGADGFFRLHTSTRGPDVAYLARERLPMGRFPSDAYPALAPNLVVEVLSPGNTKAEMARKRLEYFHAGVEVVWIVDCAERSVAVYTSPSEVTLLGEKQIINGGPALPGFSAPVSQFFIDLDIGIAPSGELTPDD